MERIYFSLIRTREVCYCSPTDVMRADMLLPSVCRFWCYQHAWAALQQEFSW